MSINRRKFLTNSAGLASGMALMGATGACTTPTQESLSDNIQSMTGGVEFITTEERINRINRAKELMHKNGIDAIYLEAGTSLLYFTGIQWWPSERMTAAIIPAKGGIHYICPAFEEERLRELIGIEGKLRVWQEHESPFELAAGILKDLHIAGGKVGIEENVRFFLSDGIKKAAPSAEFVNAYPITAGCRMIKSPAELALMKRANEITLEAYRIGFSKLQAGMSQYDLDGIVADAFAKLGATPGWVGSSFGEYTAFPHGSNTPQKLKEGDLVLIDGGCKLGGYQADITRTTIFGSPSQRQKDVWEVVKEAQTKVYEQAKAGVPCEHLDATARKVVEAAGFGSGYKNFFHRVGHGIGMDFHEWTYLVKGNQTLMEPGMCFSNEPGIYIYGELGIRIEDCFYITENGYEAFTPQSPSITQPI